MLVPLEWSPVENYTQVGSSIVYKPFFMAIIISILLWPRLFVIVSHLSTIVIFDAKACNVLLEWSHIRGST
jgi:hypothetical protein